MKISIEINEWYPVYEIEKSSAIDSLDVPDETVARWKEVFEAFEKVQREMRAIA